MSAGRSGLGLGHLGRDVPRAARSPSQRCAVRGCKVTRVQVVVSEDERYCDKHGTNRADDACRAFVRARDPACVACGDGSRGVQWAHVFSRGARYVRWDAENGVGLCSGCHYAYTKSNARWMAFVERTYPGRLVRILHREIWGQRRGYSVDVAEVIRTYRAGEPWHAEDPPPGALT